MRIDQYLAKNYPYTRSFFHHIIERGGVTVNGKKVKKSYKVQGTEDIKIDDLQRYLSPVILEESPDITIPIIQETDDYLVIQKPKNVLSHPNSIRDVQSASVVGFLYHRYKNLPSIGNFIRAGLIHRLDKNTDGYMIIVKSEAGLAHFKHLFQQKSLAKSIEKKEQAGLKKFYTATVTPTHQGKIFLETIAQNLSTISPYYIQEIVKAKVPYFIPKQGITKILAIESMERNNTAKMSLEILTGRTHQIRYHLSQKGLPILGDYLYGVSATVPMQLTASGISFVDLQGKIKSFGNVNE